MHKGQKRFPGPVCSRGFTSTDHLSKLACLLPASAVTAQNPGLSTPRPAAWPEAHAQSSTQPRLCLPAGLRAALWVLSPPEQQQLACHQGSILETPEDPKMHLTPQECKEEA